MLRRHPLLIALFLAMTAAACPPPTETNIHAESDAGGDVEDTSDFHVDLSLEVPSGHVRAGIVEKPADLIGGLKAEGRIGDFRIDNRHVAFIIEGVRRANGYHYWGGTVTDADIARPAGVEGQDLFGEATFAWNLDIFVPESADVISDGSDGTAHIRIEGRTGPCIFADHVLAELLTPMTPNLDVAFDYTLGADDHALKLSITLYNPNDIPSDCDTNLLVANSGDGVYNYKPETGLDDGYAGNLPYLAAMGRDISYGIVSGNDDLSYLFSYKTVELVFTDPFILSKDEIMTLEYYFLVTDNGVAGLDALRRDILEEEIELGHVEGTVSFGEHAIMGNGHVAVRAEAGLISVVPVREDGGFLLDLPPGQYEAIAYIPGHLPTAPETFQVLLNDTVEVTPALLPSGKVSCRVWDEAGAPMPARISFLRTGDTPAIDIPYDVRLDDLWGHGVTDVLYVLEGGEELVLPAGSYQAIASRGFSFEVDSQEVTIEAEATTTLEFQLTRAVDTTGWASADFHVHATWSPDSHVTYDTRVKQAVTEDLDLPIITEHVYLGHLQPTIDAMGMGEHIHGINAQEVTTFRFGHFNAFPLVFNPDAPNLGAVIPYDKEPVALFEAMRDQNPQDEIIQVNHPRGSAAGAYFTYVGLDSVTGEVAVPEDWTTNWDAVEVFNDHCNPTESFDDWIILTNMGYRKTLASGSDTHKLNEPPGTPRNWIQLDITAVRDDSQNLVPAVRERRLFVTCGPFIRFEAEDGTTMGGMTTVDDAGEASLHVVIEAPSWIALSHVNLRENGVTIDTIDLTVQDDPIVRLDTWIDVKPSKDAWYMLEVVGASALAPVNDGTIPNAYTNPIEVDADGDGMWTAPMAL